VLLGLQAVTRGNKWWLAYLIVGVIIAAVFLKVAINDYQKERIGA
jgi:cell division protein FtsW (lipid II flippase)